MYLRYLSKSFLSCQLCTAKWIWDSSIFSSIKPKDDKRLIVYFCVFSPILPDFILYCSSYFHTYARNQLAMNFFSFTYYKNIKVHGDSDLVQYFEELWHLAWHLLIRKSSLYQIGLRKWKQMHLNSWWQQSRPKSNQRRRKQVGKVTIFPSICSKNQKEKPVSSSCFLILLAPYIFSGLPASLLKSNWITALHHAIDQECVD